MRQNGHHWSSLTRGTWIEINRARQWQEKADGYATHKISDADEATKNTDELVKKVSETVEKSTESDIIKIENDFDRYMANDMRKSAKIKLSDSDKEYLLLEIDIIKADKNVFVFRDGFGRWIFR